MAELENDIDRICGEILKYLQKYPNSADTVEGITKWWVSRQRYEESRENVQKALSRLVARKIVCKRKNSDGSLIYTGKV